MAEPRLQQGLRGPGGAPVVGSGGIENFRRFDAGYAPRRYGEKLRDADEVFKDCDPIVFAAGKIDPLAWRGRSVLLLVGRAFLMHDPPQRQAVGGARANHRGGREKDDQRRAGDSPSPTYRHKLLGPCSQIWIERLATPSAASLIASDSVGCA